MSGVYLPLDPNGPLEVILCGVPRAIAAARYLLNRQG